jgi:hypothetical protein
MWMFASWSIVDNSMFICLVPASNSFCYWNVFFWVQKSFCYWMVFFLSSILSTHSKKMSTNCWNLMTSFKLQFAYVKSIFKLFKMFLLSFGHYQLTNHFSCKANIWQAYWIYWIWVPNKSPHWHTLRIWLPFIRCGWGLLSYHLLTISNCQFLEIFY